MESQLENNKRKIAKQYEDQLRAQWEDKFKIEKEELLKTVFQDVTRNKTMMELESQVNKAI